MCRPEEWVTIPDGFDNTWVIVKESGECLAFVSLITLVSCFTLSFSCFSASIRLNIIDEQEDFLRKVWAIPLEERKWKDLVTFDTLHAFCGGLKLTPVAR